MERCRWACGSVDDIARIRSGYSNSVEQFRKMRKSLKRRPRQRKFVDQLAPGRVFFSQRGTPYICVAWPDFDYRNVEAVRLAYPFRLRRRRIRTHRVAFQRVRESSILLESFPDTEKREEWADLLARAANDEFRPLEPAGNVSETDDLASRDMAATAERLKSYPCEKCSLFAPCHKDTGHPFSSDLGRYFHFFAKVDSAQEQLWRSFLGHYSLLQAEGYVDENGKLTQDGMWASKLRLDQPLLISEGIRKGVFPQNDPELLAALIAPFVTDRDKQGDVQLASFIWKYPDLAKPFFQMLKNLQRLRERLQAEGFAIPPLPFWALVTVYPLGTRPFVGRGARDFRYG